MAVSHCRYGFGWPHYCADILQAKRGGITQLRAFLWCARQALSGRFIAFAFLLWRCRNLCLSSMYRRAAANCRPRFASSQCGARYLSSLGAGILPFCAFSAASVVCASAAQAFSERYFRSFASYHKVLGARTLPPRPLAAATRGGSAAQRHDTLRLPCRCAAVKGCARWPAGRKCFVTVAAECSSRFRFR